MFQGTNHKLYPKIIITETKQSIDKLDQHFFFARWALEFQRANNKLYHKIIITETKSSIGKLNVLQGGLQCFKEQTINFIPKSLLQKLSNQW